MKLVVDASVAASWLLKRIDPGEMAIAEQAIEAAQRDGISVPAIWFVEVANALLTAERKGIGTSTSTARFLADLATLSIHSDSANPGKTQEEVLRLARSLSLTTYDAAYLELALRAQSSLATFDRKLAASARSIGIPLFGDSL